MEIVLKQEIYDLITQTCMDMYAEQQLLPVDRALMRLMDLPGIPMHYPYHHYIMPAALLTMAAVAEHWEAPALQDRLKTAEDRAKTILAGFCGNCGACGAGVGAGIFFSIYSGAAPTKRDNWDLTNEITGRCLLKIAEHPGPRCCKRTLFLAAQTVCDFLHQHDGPPLTVSDQIVCHYFGRNPDCLGAECPFHQEVSA